MLAQIEAGAQAVQLFDTWACVLDEKSYRRFVLPVVTRIAGAVSERAPFILFGGEAPHLASAMLESGCDVYSAGASISLAELARSAGSRVSLQGNLPPGDLALPRQEIFRRVRQMAVDAAPARGYILNLGHGCTPDTPVEGVRAFTDAARALAED